jgi:hypothetical protein
MTRSTILLFLHVFVAVFTETLPSKYRKDKHRDRQTDARDL